MVPDDDRLRLWVQALRSGQYEQARQALARVDYSTGKTSYCCLGVACEVALANGLEMETGFKTGDSDSVKVYGGETALMPAVVSGWFGLPDMDPMLPVAEDDEYDVVAATYLNDDYNWTFEQIADAIEKKFELGEETNG